MHSHDHDSDSRGGLPAGLPPELAALFGGAREPDPIETLSDAELQERKARAQDWLENMAGGTSAEAINRSIDDLVMRFAIQSFIADGKATQKGGETGYGNVTPDDSYVQRGYEMAAAHLFGQLVVMLNLAAEGANVTGNPVSAFKLTCKPAITDGARAILTSAGITVA